MALLLEGLQNDPNPVGAADVEMIADLAHGWGAMGFVHLVPDEIEDLALAMGQRA